MQEVAVAAGDGRDELGLLFAALDLQATDPRLGDRRKVLPRTEILRRTQVAEGDARDELGLLFAALDLQATDPRLGDRRKVLPRTEILRRDEVAAIEFLSGGRVTQEVVLPARLRAGASIRRSLGDHPGHQA